MAVVARQESHPAVSLLEYCHDTLEPPTGTQNSPLPSIPPTNIATGLQGHRCPQCQPSHPAPLHASIGCLFISQALGEQPQQATWLSASQAFSLI